MNASELTRREQVLERLRAAGGGWVDGTELATAEVGGSEGLKRLRELRAEGYGIEMRPHPDPDRDVRQYCLTAEPKSPTFELHPHKKGRQPRPVADLSQPPTPEWRCTKCGTARTGEVDAGFDPRYGLGHCSVCRAERTFRRAA